MVQSRATSAAQTSGLTFDKELFIARKQVKLGRSNRSILSTPAGQRSRESVRMVDIPVKNLRPADFGLNCFCVKVRETLVSKLSALAEYPHGIQEKICQSAFYQK